MKTKLCLLLCLTTTALFATEKKFYVSPSGNDAWSGTLAQANNKMTDGPFRTMQKAKEAAATVHNSPITIHVRAGIYAIEHTLRFSAAESGSKKAPIIWTNYQNEQARLFGGKFLNNLTKVTDEKILSQLQPQARGHVYVSDLRALAIADFNDPPLRMNLYFRGNRMEPARYPNQGWLLISDVPQQGEKMIHPGDHKVIKFGLPAGKHYGKFGYDDPRPRQWQNTGDLWMHGYWVWDWRDTYQKIAAIDTGQQLIYPAEPHHGYGYEKNQRYYYLNVLEELDCPGEWQLDVRNGRLYFYPPDTLRENDLAVSLLNETMIELDHTEHLLFKHLTFECANANAIRIHYGRHNVVAGCLVRNFGSDTCIVVRGGNDNGVTGCDIHDIGGTAVKIVGGDKKTLTPGRNYATNNHIYNYGQIINMFNTGVWLEGVGNTVSHNKIHNSPGSGIQYYGNDHLLEFNDLYDLAHESGDVGGINTGADYTDQGSMIRYNYIHHSHGRGEGGFRAVYLDLPGSNTTIYGNIFYKVDIGVFFNSGRDNVVQNNVFVHCGPAIGIYVWPHKQYFQPGGAWNIVEKMHTYNFQNPPYSIKYRKLPGYLEQDLGMPYGHEISNNISCGEPGSIFPKRWTRTA